MRQSGYSDTATAEVHAALGVLAKYGVLGIGVGLQNGTHSTTLGYLGMPEMQQSSAAAAAAASAATGVYGAVGQLNLDSYLHGAGTATPRTTAIDRYDPTTFDPFRHPGTQAATPISINNNAFGLGNPSALNAAAQTLGSLSKSPTPAEMTTSKEKNVEIPEVIVGAILGKFLRQQRPQGCVCACRRMCACVQDVCVWFFFFLIVFALGWDIKMATNSHAI